MVPPSSLNTNKPEHRNGKRNSGIDARDAGTKSATRETTPEALGANPQLGKRRQKLWEQIRNSGIDARSSGSKSAIRETTPEALGANPRSGKRCQRRWEQIRDPGNDAKHFQDVPSGRLSALPLDYYII